MSTTRNMEILAIIPARGQSKGIRNKNIRQFNGRPLLAYTLDAAQGSRYITRTVLSTEDPVIARVGKRLGVEVPFLRPAELAQDKSRVVDAVTDLLAKMKQREGYEPDYIVLLQPTSPLRTAADIDGALELLFSSKADSVVTVCPTEQLLYSKKADHTLHLESNKKFLSSGNRQELPATYRLDGSMVYGIKTKTLLKKQSFLAGKLVGYVIPEWRAVDLDEPADFVVGEVVHAQRSVISKKIQRFK